MHDIVKMVSKKFPPKRALPFFGKFTTNTIDSHTLGCIICHTLRVFLHILYIILLYYFKTHTTACNSQEKCLVHAGLTLLAKHTSTSQPSIFGMDTVVDAHSIVRTVN